MLPTENDMRWCIMSPDGTLAEGQGGIAIGDTKQEAWERLNGSDEWAIEQAKANGNKACRCAIMIVNP